MTIDERTQLDRINEKIDDTLVLLNETRVAVARLESREYCGKPNLCNELQLVLKDHNARLSRIESILQWSAGVIATVSLFSFICWDVLRLWLKK